MRLIRQRRGNDCGVASVAMLCDVSYARALAAFSPKVQRSMTLFTGGTSTGDCKAAIRALGWQCGDRLRPMGKRDLYKMEGRALLSVRPPHARKNGDWHWVAFQGMPNGPKVLDPATNLEPWVCDSFLPVWRE
jgi:hypothetical protein